MLKKYEIIKQLSFGHIPKAVFGYYDANENEGGILSFSEKEVCEYLSQFEIDYDSQPVSDVVPILEDLIDECFDEDLDVDFYIAESGNSYNWNGSAIFNFHQIFINGNEYTVVRFYRYGDVRGNYTDYMLLYIGFYRFIEELSYFYKSFEYEGRLIQTNPLMENGLFEVEFEGEIEYDVFLDVDDSSPEKLKDSLFKYFDR